MVILILSFLNRFFYIFFIFGVTSIVTLQNYILNIKLDVDGDFGGATANALKQFQKKYSLEVDGVYGENSYEKMKVVMK